MTTFADFEREVERVSPVDGRSEEKKYCIFALGLTGEAGEAADLIKKVFGHGHSLDRDKLLLELGDVLWYVAALAKTAGSSLEEVADLNIGKLRARYPDGFSTEHSVNRK